MIPTHLLAGLIGGAITGGPTTPRWPIVGGVVLSVLFGIAVGVGNDSFLTTAPGAFGLALANFFVGAVFSFVARRVATRLAP